MENEKIKNNNIFSINKKRKLVSKNRIKTLIRLIEGAQDRKITQDEAVRFYHNTFEGSYAQLMSDIQVLKRLGVVKITKITEIHLTTIPYDKELPNKEV